MSALSGDGKHTAIAEEAAVDELVARARAAQASFATGADQSRFDTAALAAAWAIMEPF